MSARTVVITAPDTLPQLVQQFGRGPVRIRLALPGLSDPMRVEAERRLASAVSACGCTEGAIGLILAVLPARVVAETLLAHWSSPAQWLAALAIVAVGSAVGKTIGLARARLRLKGEIIRISALL